MREYIKIDGTNLVSSRIALGTWAIGGWMWGGTDEKESIRTIHAALDQGINLIDTAPIYGYGRSEEIVGEALHQHGRRESVILATKVGIDWTNGKIERNSTRQRILKELGDSLRRLQTDYVDIYQVHWPDPFVPIEETAATLRELNEQGKIRAIGVSNYSPEEMERFRTIAPLHTIQPPYNLFEREIERDVQNLAEVIARDRRDWLAHFRIRQSAKPLVDVYCRKLGDLFTVKVVSKFLQTTF